MSDLFGEHADRQEVRVDRDYDGTTEYDWTLNEMTGSAAVDGPAISLSAPAAVVSELRAELRTLTDILDEIVENAA